MTTQELHDTKRAMVRWLRESGAGFLARHMDFSQVSFDASANNVRFWFEGEDQDLVMTPRNVERLRSCAADVLPVQFGFELAFNGKSIARN